KTRMGQTEINEYTPASFIEEYGFEPSKIVDLKALMGDASDNIPGVAGVGEKTAMDLVRRFGSISGIYSKIEGLDIKDSVRGKLIAGQESAELSFELATIRSDAPLDMELGDCLRHDLDNDKLYTIFKRLGFIKLTEKFGLTPPGMDFMASGIGAGMRVGAGPSAASSESHKKVPETFHVASAADRASLVEAAKAAKRVALRLDTEFFDSVAIAIPGDESQAVSSGSREAHRQNEEGAVVDAVVSAPSYQIYLLQRGVTDGFDGALAELLGKSVKKTGYNIKDITRACLDRGLDTDGWEFDVGLAAYLISPTDNSYEIARLSERYCDFSPSAPADDDGQMTLLSDTGTSIAEECRSIWLLDSVLSDKLKDLSLDEVYYMIEMPLCRVLAEMENEGFLVDKSALARFAESLGGRIAEIEKQIYFHAGETFNINSPKQLGVILFDKLMLPAPKKTKTGYSTNIEVLDRLTGMHPIIGFIKSYREFTKLKSTYTDGLLKVVEPDGRIHTHFQMTVTATGRLSSTEPNLQNIPVRKELGGELRKMFVAGDGNVLVDADYSQIELRLLAHIASDPVMTAAFESGEDIHTVTASQVFGVPPGDVTSVQRFRAKAVNFGIVYGISPFSLASDIDVTTKVAKEYIYNYLEKYAGVRKYMADIVESAKRLGYVATLFGRRRYLPELTSSNFNTRSFGERVALNMPIQGTAADIMKIAMINVSARLKAEKLKAKLILQVHDELIVECPEDEVDAASRVLREEMEGAAKLSVPLVAETRVGKSWYDAK
ncbi:MAG: DNA polymerase I, partial [Oscillospiraceae bacterium]|nr:DNA polymerase I [Oscillospiraceae bacterium]